MYFKNVNKSFKNVSKSFEHIFNFLTEGLELINRPQVIQKRFPNPSKKKSNLILLRNVSIFFKNVS